MTNHSLHLRQRLRINNLNSADSPSMSTSSVATDYCNDVEIISFCFSMLVQPNTRLPMRRAFGSNNPSFLEWTSEGRGFLQINNQAGIASQRRTCATRTTSATWTSNQARCNSHQRRHRSCYWMLLLSERTTSRETSAQHHSILLTFLCIQPSPTAKQTTIFDNYNAARTPLKSGDISANDSQADNEHNSYICCNAS